MQSTRYTLELTEYGKSLVGDNADYSHMVTVKYSLADRLINLAIGIAVYLILVALVYVATQLVASIAKYVIRRIASRINGLR
jgi:hypothetical protein